MDNFIDFSNVTNRRLFIDAGGNPVNLGTDGSLPTGSAPDIFLSGDTDTWHVNKGTSGGFTENGTLTTAAGPNATSLGLVAHYKLDETSSTTAVDSSGNGYDDTMENGLDAANDSVAGANNDAQSTAYFRADGHHVVQEDGSGLVFQASDTRLQIARNRTQ